MHRFLYILAFYVFVHSHTCFGQQKIDNLNDTITRILTEIYQFQLSKYNEDIDNLKTIDLPDNQYRYLKANLQWWYILNGHNNKNDQRICINYIDQSIDAYKQKRNINIEDKLTLFSAYILKMRVNNLGDHKLKSARLLLKILNLSEDLIEEMPNGEQKTFIKGVYHYFTNYAKEESIVASIFLYGYSDENKEKGLKYLEKAAQSSNSAIRTEAHYLLYKIYSTLENNKQKALDNAEWLSHTYPENIFYKAEYFLTLCRSHFKKKSLIVKNKLLQQIEISSELDEKEKQYYYNLTLKCKTGN